MKNSRQRPPKTGARLRLCIRNCSLACVHGRGDLKSYLHSAFCIPDLRYVQTVKSVARWRWHDNPGLHGIGLVRR